MDLTRQALTSDSDLVEQLYRDLESLNCVPHLSLTESDRIVQVSGFEYGALFYVTDCFIKPTNEGTPDLTLTVVNVHSPSIFEVKDYSHRGDCLFEVARPEDVLMEGENTRSLVRES